MRQKKSERESDKDKTIDTYIDIMRLLHASKAVAKEERSMDIEMF